MDKSKENPTYSPSSDKSVPDKASSVIVSANLFQEVLLAQLIIRDSKEQVILEGKVPPPPEESLAITNTDSDISRPSIPSWNNLDVELALHGLANYQASQPISGSSTDVHVSSSPNSLTPPNTTNSDWSFSSDLIFPNANNVGNPPTVSSNSSSNNTSLAAPPFSGYGFDTGFNMNAGTNTGRDMDWITFMQLSGLTVPDPEVNLDTAFDAGVGMDWESLQFS